MSETSPMVAKSLREMQLGLEYNVIVMGIRQADGRMLFNPTADTTVNAGEYLIVMGRPETLQAIEGLLADTRSART